MLWYHQYWFRDGHVIKVASMKDSPETFDQSIGIQDLSFHWGYKADRMGAWSIWQLYCYYERRVSWERNQDRGEQSQEKEMVRDKEGGDGERQIPPNGIIESLGTRLAWNLSLRTRLAWNLSLDLIFLFLFFLSQWTKRVLMNIKILFLDIYILGTGSHPDS